MFEYFTDRAIAVVMLAQEEARRLAQTSVGTEQLLLGLLREQTSVAAQILAEMGITLDEAREVVEAISGRGSGPVPAEIPFTPKTRRLMEQALEEARQRKQRFVGPEHLLLALLNQEGTVALQALLQLDVNPNDLRLDLVDALEENLVATGGGDGTQPYGSESPERKGRFPVLEEFGTNLTEKAIAGQIDPVIGRDMETERVVQILGRRTKNNPILVGEPGVGKTAIAEGLAQRIANQDVPENLLKAQIVSLDLTGLVAGTRFRGEFEERLTQLLDELRNASQQTILVIDEIHMLMGAGAMGGSMDAANLMKPALARGEIQCIGATTMEEFRQYIEKDAALERRFQPVQVSEPSSGETLEILHGVRSVYEQHHRLSITDGALEAAAQLSDRYISDRFLPDKAIDLIDEAASRVRLRYGKQQASKEVKQELRAVCVAKQEAIRSQDYASAADLRERELSLEAQLQSQRTTAEVMESVRPEIPALQTPTVDAEDIAQVLSAWTGIPVMKLTESESLMLMHLEETLHKRVIGQDEAVTAVAKAMRRARVNLQSPDRPIASFFFSGPTGVGKTELSKALSAELFGSEEAIIRVDMSEFMESHTVSKLIGSPPGFAGHEDGGKLTEAVRRNPYSIILFDEVEKAHPDIFNIMLQVLDDGRLTDSRGRTVDFKNTVIIMTSNLGSKAIEKSGAGLGFDFGGDDSAYERIRARVTDELKQFFRPEFLNRLDELIVFRQLTQPEVAQIAEILVQELADRLQDKGIGLVATEAFKARAVEEGYDQRYGARPLRRALQRLLEDPLAEAILSGEIGEGDTAQIDLDTDNQVTIQCQAQLAAVVSR